MEWAYVISAIVGVGILFVFICLIYCDIRYKKLPNIFMIALIVLSLIFTILTEMVIEQKSYSIILSSHFLALLPVTGLYLIIYVVSRGRLVGLGDVKLGIPIAILLPWQGAIVVLVLANLMAFAVIIPLLITKKIKSNTKIPFGPFLIVACLLTFLGMKFFVNLF